MRLAEIQERFRALRIVVVGDIMLDHYVWGDTHRISPEAPVPVVEIQRETETAGGAANVALNLAALGVNVEVCGTIGQDAAGDRLRTILGAGRIQFDPRFHCSNTLTIVKTRIMVRGQQLCRLDREAAPANYALSDQSDSVLEKLHGADAVILSDYAKGVLTQDLVSQLGAAAEETRLLVALDPKPRRCLHVPGLACMTPNRHEAFELAGLSDQSGSVEFPAREIGERIFSRHPVRFLVVTLGAAGMMLYDSPEQHRHLPTEAQEVFDVSGAGDTVVAVLTAGLAAGLDLEAAGRLANAAAGVVVGKLGTATTSWEELLGLTATTLQGPVP